LIICAFLDTISSIMQAHVEQLTPSQRAHRKIDRRGAVSQWAQRTIFGVTVAAGVLGGMNKFTDGAFGIPLEASISTIAASTVAGGAERRHMRRSLTGTVARHEVSTGAVPGSHEVKITDEGEIELVRLPTRYPTESYLAPISGGTAGFIEGGFPSSEHSSTLGDVFARSGLTTLFTGAAVVFHLEGARYQRAMVGAAHQQIANIDATVA
jgi:hypothetical protein